MTHRTKRILRRPVVRDRTGLGDTMIDRLESEERFPKRIKITARAVGWPEDEINKWVEDRLSGVAA